MDKILTKKQQSYTGLDN